MGQVCGKQKKKPFSLKTYSTRLPRDQRMDEELVFKITLKNIKVRGIDKVIIFQYIDDWLAPNRLCQ